MARNVLLVHVLHPVRVRFFVVTHEESKQDDHSDLPDEAHRGQADPHVGVLGGAPETPAAVGYVSHVEMRCSGGDSVGSNG